MAKPPDDASPHERAHAAAGRGEGLPSQTWYRDRQGNARVSHGVPSGKSGSHKAAVVQAAGYLSSGPGFADDNNDREYAKVLAKEAGVPLREIEAEARRKGYVNAGAASASGCTSLIMMSVALVGVVVLGLARMRRWGR